ncbi:MAG: DNA polymerase III subunit delta' [Gammaproteobacteria bacterium]|nr:DNA polymerase III subunit delta' [Gammaproteobacteria bacterium]
MPESAYQRLPWQEEIWFRLQQARKQERLPHALLFTGPAGVGKVNFAFAFTQSLLCAQADDRGEPCGVCRHCHLLLTGNHPDFQWIGPEEGSKSGEIRIASVRELTKDVSLTTQSGGYKVVIVSPADRMNSAAANSLLKTLEEPVSNTLLMLISDNPSRLLPTIRSRCQQFTFPYPEQNEAIAWLTERVASGDPESLLALAGGAPLLALDMLGDDTITKRQSAFKAFIDLSQARIDPVKIAAEWSKQDDKQLLEWLTGWLVDMLRLQVTGQPPLLYNREDKQALQRMAQPLNSAALQRFLLQVYEARRLTDNNLNSQLMLEKLLIDWYACLHRAGR